MKNFEDLVPGLLNSFQQLIPLVATRNVEEESFCCISSILQSLDYIIKSFVYRADVAVWDITISSAFLEKLFPLFPLDPVHEVSEKTFIDMFRGNKLGSILKSVCLSAIDDLLTPVIDNMTWPDTSNEE